MPKTVEEVNGIPSMDVQSGMSDLVQGGVFLYFVGFGLQKNVVPARWYLDELINENTANGITVCK